MQAATAAPTPDQQWWGHSKQHGWVVLDRSIAGNGPGTKQTLFFMRCKDMTTFTITRKEWQPPAYVFAPNYLRALVEPEASGASDTLSALQARWPEIQQEIQRQFDESQPKPVEEPPPPKKARAPRKAKVVETPVEAPAAQQAG